MSSAGASILAVGYVLPLSYLILSLFIGKRAGANPWRATGLEWTIPSPAGHGNFDVIPTVYHGPYEYSSPLTTEDYLPQDRPIGGSGENVHIGTASAH